MDGVKDVPCKSQKLSSKSLGSKLGRKYPFTLVAGEGRFQETPQQYIQVVPLSLIVSKNLKVKRTLLLGHHILTTYYLEQLN